MTNLIETKTYEIAKEAIGWAKSTLKIDDYTVYGGIKKGDTFSITHCDGYVANEEVSHISIMTKSKPMKWGYSVYHSVGVEAIHVVCESGCSYNLKDVKVK